MTMEEAMDLANSVFDEIISFQKMVIGLKIKFH